MFPVQSADGWKLLLNDFGSAIPYSGKIVARRMSCQHELHLHFCIPALAPGPPKLFGGCLEHAHDDVLDGYASEPPVAVLYTPRFDLEMVVRCVYHWMHPATYSLVLHKPDVKKERVAWIKLFWRQRLAAPWWQRLIKAARQQKYRTIKTLISDMNI